MKKRASAVLLLWIFSLFLPYISFAENQLIAQSDINVDVSRFNFTDELTKGAEKPLNGADRTQFETDTFRPKFYTREQWGADENLRVWKKERGIDKIFRKVPEEAKFLDKKDWPIITERANAKGERYTWPIEKNLIIKKIIIHNTGEYVDDDSQIRKDPKSYMRSIYYYHTITRKWGDIGYNFVIDKKGNIYEGRYGGPDTVGAHTAYYNTGTIGIALMGNFSMEEPTEAQLKVLSILIGYLADKYNIDPFKKDVFLGINADNITGHTLVARQGNGTSCPGKNMIKRFPDIRNNVLDILKTIQDDREAVPKGLDFLQKSSAAPNIQKFLPRFTMQNKKPLISTGQLITERMKIQRSETKDIEIELNNNSQRIWPAGAELVPITPPEGMILSTLRAAQEILPNKSGVFRGKIKVIKTPNGEYDLQFDPIFAKEQYFEGETRPTFTFPITISGDKNITTVNTTVQQISTAPTFVAPPIVTSDAKIRNVKVKLAFLKQKFAQVRSQTTIQIYNQNDERVALIDPEIIVKITNDPVQKDVVLQTTDGEKHYKSVTLKTDGVLELVNYNRGLGSTPYNKFRKRISFYFGSDGNILAVNELPIEEYLYGLAEEPAPEPTEKKHTIHILARSYALVYAGERRKFQTSLYDLEDDPKTSQLYLGYDWERFHPEQQTLVKQTEGQVLTVNDVPVIGPYFTQSAGESLGVWKKQYPWAKVQKIPYDEGLVQKGHGVGLSGHAATALANEGKNYQEIINYFFEGVQIKKAY